MKEDDRYKEIIDDRARGERAALSVHPHDSVSILHELDLGLHTLLLMSDGSIELLANAEEQTPSLVETGLHLDSDETYRLLISLQEQFKQKDACQ